MQKHIHGGDIYSRTYKMDFSANINPLGMPESAVNAAIEGVRMSQNYPDVNCRRLKQAISEAESVPEEWIICGNGAAELIFALVMAVRPKKALLITPGFAEYEQALAAAGCEIQFYECLPENEFVPQSDFLKNIHENIEMIFVCNPNNPTGTVFPQRLLEETIKICHEKKILLVLDECFNSFLLQGKEISMTRALHEIPELFILKAFTKLYAMAGLRLGYGLSQNSELLKQILEVLQPWNVSIPAQMAGVAALQEKEFAEKTLEYIAKERTFLKQEFQKVGIRYYDSQANFIFFEGPENLEEQCREHGILIRDCSNYRGLQRGYYRIAVRSREENQELLQVLKLIMK